MKKFSLYIISFAATMLVACSVNEPCQKCEEARKSQELKHVALRLTSGASSSTTKLVSDPDDESRINSCSLYVFSTDGQLFESLVSEEPYFEFFIGGGTYDIYAFANAPQHPQTIALADNSSDNLVMTGSLQGKTISESSQIIIGLSRMVAKVNYSVYVDIRNEILRQLDFRILSVYMTNVVGEEQTFSQGYVPDGDHWYNKRNYEPSDADRLLYSEPDELVASGDSLRTKSTFYIFPNNCEDPEDRSGWSPRRTRFVVKALMGSQIYYYPVTMPDVLSNHEYVISLTIRNIGYLDPEDVDVTPQAAESSIVIQAWNDGGEIEYVR